MFRVACLAVVFFAGNASILKADVKLPPVFSSHAVFQRDMPVPVFGTAAPGEKVTVKFREQEKSATADAKGNWLVKLDAVKAGGPDSLTIAGANTISLDDILVGEVWVGSGQSNMAGTVDKYVKGDPVLAEMAAKSFPKVRHLTSGGVWKESTPANNPRFSALLFSFGVRVQENQSVPVGLMLGAVGGTPSGYWLSPAALAADGPCQEQIKKLSASWDEAAEQKKYAALVAKWEESVKEAEKKGAKPGKKPFPPAKPGVTRGGAVGFLYAKHIVPLEPYAIRGVLWDQGEAGTAIDGIDQFTLMGALISGWRKEWGQGEFPFIYVQKPSGAGCAWDRQNAMTNQAREFAPLPAKMPDTEDGLYMETHVRIREYPHTAMATSTDLGPMTHPTNKSGYGARAAQVAAGLAYGGKAEHYGPIYASHTIESGKVRIKFTHVGQGLAQKHGEKLQGFAIAGDDKVFQWADAAIEGDTVVVSSPSVPKPAAVRYAWSKVHPWANLFNKDGLPALTFRTDNW